MLLQLSGERPLYRAVTRALREAILAGTLAGGTRLPGTRALARELGISRIVVVAAFEQLAAEGYIVSAAGSGSRVAVVGTIAPTGDVAPRSPGQLNLTGYAARALALMPHQSRAAPTAARRAVVDFAYATFVPDERTQRAWLGAVGRAARTASFDYPEAAGLAALRDQLCRHLRRHRGIDAQTEDVLVVTGSQQALDLTARAICEKGTRVGIEDPHYQGARQAFLANGARLIPCSLDHDGFDIERHAVRLSGAGAVYVTPSHQFPTGAVMNVERRLKLLAWANEKNVWVIEDDYDSEFHYGSGTVPALRGLDAGRNVIYVGTFARTLSPALRLGYIVVPPPLREAFQAMKWLADRGSSPLEQRALSDLMETGAYERAQRRMARSLAERRRRFSAALHADFAGTDVAWAGAGAHLFVRLPSLVADDAEALIEECARRGVRVYGASAYHLLAPHCATLVCGYAALTGDEIERGVARLAAAYRTLKTAVSSNEPRGNIRS